MPNSHEAQQARVTGASDTKSATYVYILWPDGTSFALEGHDPVKTRSAANALVSAFNARLAVPVAGEVR